MLKGIISNSLTAIFSELNSVQDRLSKIGLVDLIGINAIKQEDFDYNYPETLIIQRSLGPVLHSFYLLENDGCLLIWHFGMCTRLNIGLVYCLVYSFHKVVIQKFDDCQVLVCKGYRRDVGLKVADKICKSMEQFVFDENSCILEVVPSNYVLDKRWFVKCLNRANDRFFQDILKDG